MNIQPVILVDYTHPDVYTVPIMDFYKELQDLKQLKKAVLEDSGNLKSDRINITIKPDTIGKLAKLYPNVSRSKLITLALIEKMERDLKIAFLRDSAKKGQKRNKFYEEFGDSIDPQIYEELFDFENEG